MAEKGVRIRLKFQDAGILTKQQIDQGLAQCWHLVRFDDVRTIADVACDITSIFNLGESCPNGLGLEVDGFALPPSQSAQLLKDSDLVRIRRKKDPPSTPGAEVPRNMGNDQHFIINGYRYAGYGGLELRAIDEFEKEKGGYKSEEEEGEMETDITLDGGARTVGDPKVAPIFLKEMEKASKKRKRAKDQGTELGKKRRNSGNELALSLGNSEANQEKLKANKVSQRTGVNLRALDEFERELGGYESEQEEDENEEETDFSLGGTKNVTPFEVRPLGTPREEKRVAKKHKNSKKDVDIRDDDQMQQLKSAVNDVEEEPNESLKKKKKRKSEVIVIRQTEDGVEMCPVKSKERKKLKRAEKDEDLRVKDEKLDAPPESSRNEDGASQGGATNICKQVKDSKTTPGDDPHRPSRSARRKKAKRKWLREQQAKAAKLSTEEDVVKKLPRNEEIVEVETVEEALPSVVRVGHIRFEPQGEDHCGAPSGSSLPVLNLGKQPKSKRQGQNWGQEKTAEKHKGKRWIEETEDVECLEAYGFSNGKCKNKDHVDLEKLPSLQGAPQEGDAIAYRLVELTTSWTPELSPYRVGVVVSVDLKTDGIKLAPHPDYPFCCTKDAELGDGLDEEGESYRPPYEEDGFLETDLHSLVDMRLLEKKLVSKRCQAGEEFGMQLPAEDKRSDTLEDGPSLALPIQESVEHTEMFGLSNTQVGNETELLVTKGSGQNPTLEMMSKKASGDEKETDKDATSSPDWQTQLTKELQRKKLEIRQKSADSGGNKTSGEPVKAASKRSKSKYLRSAGVGTIVALLRAQQAL